MAKMTVIYKTPQDIASFDRHYFEVHIPLAKQLPRLLKYEVSDGPIMSTTGHGDVYRIANLYFQSLDAMKGAFGSDIGKRCAEDRRVLAPNNEDAQIYLYDAKDV
jgi:uncharacterized protein (TIGR02118 family)